MYVNNNKLDIIRSQKRRIKNDKGRKRKRRERRRRMDLS
jgi:hypothetical protein